MIKVNNRKEIINLYIDFFTGKGCKELPNGSLIPENDPTALFTTSGMHPLVPYLLGLPHPLGTKLVNVQKSLRTTDIESVGDDFHLTLFEMLGNWSLGAYWKAEQLPWAFEFVTKVLKIPLANIAVTCFKGDSNALCDMESAEIWRSLGIPKNRIVFLPAENNWWGPVGETGPCGPDTEVFYWIGKGKPKGNPLTNEKEWAEIWNAGVFMQYNKNKDGKFETLKKKCIDTGLGVERTLAVLQGKKSVYDTNVFLPLIEKIEKLSGKKYGVEDKNTRAMRIIADHIKASTFIIAEKVKPSNAERGYVLRRLIRRALRYARLIGITEQFTKSLAQEVLNIYFDYYYLQKNKNLIFQELEEEELRFSEVIDQGIIYFEKNKNRFGKVISGKEAFLMYQSFGFPIEMTQELAKENNLEVNVLEYEKEAAKHQELSRTASAGVFKAGLADHSQQAKKYHTATHLLLAALKQILGGSIEQRGSNINAERLRFDFSHPDKLTDKQLKEIEAIVNKNISQGLDVKREELSLEQAKKSGATGIFDDKYGDLVSVYTVCDPMEGNLSREICSGPHVTNTKELGKFKIVKEEASARGIRRIKAILS